MTCRGRAPAMLQKNASVPCEKTHIGQMHLSSKTVQVFGPAPVICAGRSAKICAPVSRNREVTAGHAGKDRRHVPF